MGATAVSGVPSTGQKLNLSANSSWHLEQNFIDTTSSRLRECSDSVDPDRSPALENSLAKLVSIRLSRTLEGPGVVQRSSKALSSSSESNLSSDSTPISGLLQSNNFPTTIQLLITGQIRPQRPFQALSRPVQTGFYRSHIRIHDPGNLVQAQPFVLVQNQGFPLQLRQPKHRVSDVGYQLFIKQPAQRRVSWRNFRLFGHFLEPRLAPGTAEVLQGQVSGNREHVRSQRGALWTIAIRTPNQAQKAVVRDVFRNFN